MDQERTRNHARRTKDQRLPSASREDNVSHMALITASAFAKRLRQFMGPVAEDAPERLATLGDGNTSVVSLDYDAHPVRLLATSPMERKWRARSCKKEPWTVAWIEETMSGGGVLYDVGANVGTFSLVAAKVCARRGTVVAFEPGFASYAHLCGNIVLNRCEPIIIPVPLALSGTCGLGSFRYLSVDPGQSRHDFRQDAWVADEADTPKRYLQPMLSMTLDPYGTIFSRRVPGSAPTCSPKLLPMTGRTTTSLWILPLGSSNACTAAYAASSVLPVPAKPTPKVKVLR